VRLHINAGAQAALRQWRGRGARLSVGSIATRVAPVWPTRSRFGKTPCATRPTSGSAHFQLAFAYFQQTRYGEALEEFQKTRPRPVTPDLLLDWGLAYDHLGQFDQALPSSNRRP